MKRKLLFKDSKRHHEVSNIVPEEYASSKPEMDQTAANIMAGLLQTSTFDGKYRPTKEATAVTDPSRMQEWTQSYDT